MVDGIPALLVDPAETPDLPARLAGLDAEAARYALVMAAFALAAGIWPPAERRRFVARLGLRAGDRVLDHCSGPGGDLPALAEAVGPTGTVVAMDLSAAMLRRGQRLARRRRFRADSDQAAARRLPYADGTFDAVMHVGAINQFGAETREAVDEMVRVTRPGGVVAIVDEGLAPERARTLLGRLLIRRNALFASRPPLDALPAWARPELTWGGRGVFYQLIFTKPPAAR